MRYEILEKGRVIGDVAQAARYVWVWVVYAGYLPRNKCVKGKSKTFKKAYNKVVEHKNG